MATRKGPWIDKIMAYKKAHGCTLTQAMKACKGSGSGKKPCKKSRKGSKKGSRKGSKKGRKSRK